MRLEKDSLGTKKIPSHAYYGINAARAIENFSISGLKAHPQLIDAFLIIKKSAALANQSLNLIPRKIGSAIVQACDEILKGRLRDQFVVDVFQMGAGTALHMNVNEVLANRAIEILGGKKGETSKVHPSDHVNFGQSTNDVFPTAIRIAGRRYLDELIPVLKNLASALTQKGKEFDPIIKSARTHLQDAVPIRLGQEFKAYGVAIEKATRRIMDAAKELEELGIGGSAAGTGLNTHPRYRDRVVANIRKFTKLPFRSAGDLRESMQSQRPVAEVSSALKNLAVELSRICNDLRLLSSGPTTGFGEIVLPAVQAGSSIMPGKVNPSMAEMLNMVCFQVMGNDLAVTLAVQAGQLELNVMMPLMAYDLLFSIEILKNGVKVFTEKCVKGIKADKAQCRRYAERSLSLVTALTPTIGYEKAAEIFKDALASEKSILEVIRNKNLISPKKLKQILDLRRLTEPGVNKL
ncbi:MAG: aspartate ammonia-lyase [Elusimicrobia bacterium]|nr:aspartate ammonia-lyase [Candidatus Obscuribacterium magneticum]